MTALDPFALGGEPSPDLLALRERVAAVVAEFDVPLPDGDAGLVEAARRLPLLRSRSDVLYPEFHIDAEIEEREIVPSLFPLEERLWNELLDREPQSIAGLLCKLKWAQTDKTFHFDSHSDALVASIIPAVERMTAREEIAAGRQK